LASDVLGKLPESICRTDAGAFEPRESHPPEVLGPDDSLIFRAPTEPGENAGCGGGQTRPFNISVARMPQLRRSFSFDTIDKVAPPVHRSPDLVSAPVSDEGFSPLLATEEVAPPLHRASDARPAPMPDETLSVHMSGPNAVAVNEIFQQIVQIRNDSARPMHDVRVTQICDLKVLGAPRHQAVSIDCLSPGESKSVLFAARAQQAGAFPVRYVAQCHSIESDVREIVQVNEAQCGGLGR
jgi:hypothetical protein